MPVQFLIMNILHPMCIVRFSTLNRPDSLIKVIRRTVFLFSLLFCFLKPATACKCAEHPPLTKQQCTPYDLIFEGIVDSVAGGKEGFGRAFFKVKGLYKGETLSACEVRFDNTSDCAMSFQKGDEWIVYTQYYKYGMPGVDFCSRSRKKIDSGDDYYVALNGMSYTDERNFLVQTFGTRTPQQQTKSDMPGRILIQPTAYWKLWLLLISVVVLYLIIYLVKKMP
jgi:hypothetical protein